MSDGDRTTCQCMYVIRTDEGGEARNKACCYSERDADEMVRILGGGASWDKVPIATFHDARR